MKIYHAIKPYALHKVELDFEGSVIILSVHDTIQNLVDSETGHITESAEVVNTARIEFSDLVNSPQAETGACWNVYFDGNSKFPVMINSNAMASTFRGDVHQTYVAYAQKPPTLVICIPRLDSTIDECLFGVNTVDEASESFICKLPYETFGRSSDLDMVRKMVRPKFAMTGLPTVSQGGTDTFVVTVQKVDGSVDTDFNDPIYFETTGGTLAVSKVKAVNGVAQVRLVGTNLLAGDVIAVKAGTKFYTSLAKMDVQVTA
jgi:hypothetical protein